MEIMPLITKVSSEKLKLFTFLNNYCFMIIPIAIGTPDTIFNLLAPEFPNRNF